MASKRQCSCCEKFYDGPTQDCPHCKATVVQQCEAWDNAFGDMKDQRNAEAGRCSEAEDRIAVLEREWEVACKQRAAAVLNHGECIKKMHAFREAKVAIEGELVLIRYRISEFVKWVSASTRVPTDGAVETARKSVLAKLRELGLMKDEG